MGIPSKEIRIDPRHGVTVATAVALLAGGIAAVVCAWTSDDAFISYRYARNLVEGHGLVFNPGERVEGYTNFLWTVWMAPALALGLDVERWSWFWSISSYLGSLLLLAWNHTRLRRSLNLNGFSLPVAAIAAAFCLDWNIYATSGLETAPFTFLLIAGYVLLVGDRAGPREALGAGSVLGLASLTRPDGTLLVALGGAWVLLRGIRPGASEIRLHWKNACLYGAAASLLLVPFLAWRGSYYGELVPNTYYAKSAYLTWYSQGMRYAWVFFQRYWVVSLGPALLLGVSLLAWRRRRPETGPVFPQALGEQIVLATLFAGIYTVYIIRVGGDFMFARMLIPPLPFYLLLIEFGVLAAFRTRSFGTSLATGAVVAALVGTPSPVSGKQWYYGIADEYGFYTSDVLEQYRHYARLLSHYLGGLEVRIAFFGTEARLMYEARIPVAIESETGLTDKTIARQTLTSRRRVGHEKQASMTYLIDQRRAHFQFKFGQENTMGTPDFIPMRLIFFPDPAQPDRRDLDIPAIILHWDGPLMAELVRRGASVEDFPTWLEGYIGAMPGFSDDKVARDFKKFQRFYFNFNPDPQRLAPFKARIGEVSLE